MNGSDRNEFSIYTSLLLLSRLHGCYFSGWGSPVDGLLISETSTFTIDNVNEARKGRTAEPWRSPPNRQRRRAIVKAHQKSTSALTEKNEFSYTSTSRIFCCRPLCTARVQLQCKVIGDWSLRRYDTHLQRTLACGCEYDSHLKHNGCRSETFCALPSSASS